MSRICIYVNGIPDVVDAARKARTMAAAVGFATEQADSIATVAAELAANLFIHAGGGVLVVSRLSRPGTDQAAGLEMVATDNGPGIADIGPILQGSAGVQCRGLPCVQLLMDELEIDSRVGEGSVVLARKWL